MTTTPELIAALAANATPVRRLRHPLVRASSWLLLAALVVALLAVSQGLRPDLAQRLEQPTFAIGIAAALLTGVLAAIASCLISLPDRSRLWSLLPVPTLLLWLSTIGYGCLTSWIGLGPDGMRTSEVARCFATLLLTSVPLSVAMLVMLRHAAPLYPRLTVVVGSLGVAAITASAVSLFHDLDATVMILAWNFGTAAMIVGTFGVLGRKAFSWGGLQSRLWPTGNH
jgi:hypothetical protein